MIGKERAKLVGPVSQRQEHVRNEAGFFLHREDPGADVLRHLVDGGRLKSLGGGLGHERVPAGARGGVAGTIYRIAAEWIPAGAKNRRERLPTQRSGFFRSENRSGSSPI